jgi:hypothetical protein
VHESVLDPVLPNVTLEGERVQLRPVLGETAVVSVTVPVNPWILVTNIVEIPDTPALTMTLVGLTVTEKSWTVTATFAEWESTPLVPVTDTV